MRYAYVWNKDLSHYVPQIALDGPFKGVRVDHLPFAETLQKAYEILQTLPFVPIVEMRPTRVYFELNPSDAIVNGNLQEQRDSVKQLLKDEFGENILFALKEIV